MHNIRNSVQKFTKQLCDDFDQHLNHARTTIAGGQGAPGERENVIKKIAGMNLLEGFSEMYGMLQKMKKDACKTLPGMFGHTFHKLDTQVGQRLLSY